MNELPRSVFPDFNIYFKISNRCSLTSPHLVARLAPNTGALIVHRMLICSKIVRLIAIDITFSKENLVSFSWSLDGTLLLCDEDGNICSVDFDEEENRRVRKIIEIPSKENPSMRRLMLVAHKNGALVIEDLPDERSQKIQARACICLSRSEFPLTFVLCSSNYPI